MKASRLIDGYKAFALLFVNTLLLFVLLNGLAWAALALHKRFFAANPVAAKYGKDALRLVYPGMAPAQLDQLLRETWTRGFAFEPFTQFTEAPFNGTYVNVLPPGFRKVADQAPWPPDPKRPTVFVFGGSTTFGYGLADAQTLPSHLQRHLRDKLGRDVAVYNFGRGSYFSTQERILFEQLLAAGWVPDLAVFVDGLNDFHHADGNPRFTRRLSDFLGGGNGAARLSVLEKLPIARLVGMFAGGKEATDMSPTQPGTAAGAEAALPAQAAQRYVQNKKIAEAVAAAYGVRVAFVWQPVPNYNYDLAYHPFAPSAVDGQERSRKGYPLMHDLIAQHPPGDNFLWAADLQLGVARPLYVDSVHYSGEFSQQIAEFVGDWLIAKDLLSPQRKLQ